MSKAADRQVTVQCLSVLVLMPDRLARCINDMCIFEINSKTGLEPVWTLVSF